MNCPQEHQSHISQENVAQSIGYCFAAGALLFSALGSVLTKKISHNFDKKVISSAIGFSILIIAFCTPFMDKLIDMPNHNREVTLNFWAMLHRLFIGLVLISER